MIMHYYIVVVTMITDIMLQFLKDLESGKVKKKDNPRKYSAYMKRIRKMIDEKTANLLWLAEHRPDILSDLEYELADETLPMKRRAKALMKAIALFENEPTVIEIISNIYTQHSIELTHKKPLKVKLY